MKIFFERKTSFDIFFLLFLLVIFVVPLEKIGEFDLGGISFRLSQILAIITFGLWLISQLFKKKLILIFPYPLVFYVLFLCAGAFSLLFARDQGRGIFVLAFYTFMILVPFLFVNIINIKERLKSAVLVFVLVALLASLFGIFQFFGDILGLPQSVTGLSHRYVGSVMGVPRIQSSFIEPLYFANFLFFPLFFTFFSFFLEKAKNTKIFLILLSILFFVTIILTFSKGAWLTLLFVIPLAVLFQIKNVFCRRNLAYIASAIVVLFFAGALFVPKILSSPDFGRIYEKAYNVTTDGSLTERVEAYGVAWEAFTNNFGAGIGIGNFGPYFAGYPQSMPDYGWPIVNNQYLEVLSETGILGICIFLLFLASLFFRSWIAYVGTSDKYFKLIILATTISFLAILIQYMTFSTFYIMHVWVVIGIMLSAQSLALRNRK